MASGIIEVLLVGAEGIKQRNKLGCFNCFVPCHGVTTTSYVLIKYQDQECASTVAKRQGRRRVWNEKLKLKVDYKNIDEIQNQNHKLVFYIGDKHVSSDEFVGESTIYVKDLVVQGMEKGKEEIKHRKYRVVRPDQSYSGEIFVAVSFTKLYDNKGKDGTDKEVFDLEGQTI